MVRARSRVLRTFWSLVGGLLLLFALGATPGCEDQPVPSPPPEPVATASQADITWQQIKDLITILDSTGALPESVSHGIEWMEHIQELQEMLENFERCVEEGNDVLGCAAQHIFWAGLCYLAQNMIEDAVPGLKAIGLPLKEVCQGKPPLKCCKYDAATQGGCHSAFNSEAPINCEGNFTAPNAKSYGPCLPPPNHIGCLCNYIPECGIDPATVDDPDAKAWRFDHLAGEIAAAFTPRLKAQPQKAGAFVAFLGCRAHQAVMTTFPPFAKQDSMLCGLNPGSDYFVDDDNPDARYLRALITLAVRRVLTGIPNIAERWNFVDTRTWTQAQIDAYLGNVDADAVLLAQLGPFGLQLLEDAEPVRYKLLAIPLPGEIPDPLTANYVAGCEPGAPPVLDLQVTNITATTVTLNIVINDPLAADNPSGAYLVGIDWGDGRVLGYPFIQSDPSTHTVTHSYAGPGTYAIYGTVPNTSGLRGEDTEVVTLAAGAGNPGPISVGSIEVDLLGTITAHTHGEIWVDVLSIDALDRLQPLGRYWAKAVGASFSTVTVNLDNGPLQNFNLSNVKGLLLRPFRADGYLVSFEEMTLGSVIVSPHASQGMPPPASITYWPTNQDVQIYAPGAVVPGAPLLEIGTNRLRLPAQGADIRVYFPQNPGPDPNAAFRCRPVYGVDNPLMVSAQGGCHDLATGFTWSTISLSTMNWHDAMWDSTLAGNAPSDATDYGRANDYPQQYPLGPNPDSSTINYCHELTQGGYTDWRLPTQGELFTIMGFGASTYFAFDAGNFVWSSETWFPGGGTLAIARALTGGPGSIAYTDKNAAANRTICVRDGAPPPQGICRVGGGNVFVTGSGGCKDTRPGGLVWSKSSVLPTTWYQAIWGSELAGNAPPDAYDFGRTNDYAGGFIPPGPDVSFENYCHSLVEGGFSDWRMPNPGEIFGVKGSANAGTYFSFDIHDGFWSSNTSFGLVDTYDLSADLGGHGFTDKNGLARVVCVRTPIPGDCPDADGDGICDAADNCQAVANTSQTDTNADGIGDACQAGAAAGNGAPCATNDGCASSFCVDGVCCNNACGGGLHLDCKACSVPGSAGTCSPSTGNTCYDANACTRTDTCQAGACVASNPVVCDAAPCHTPGTCDTITGACSSATVQADGTACDDGNSCTQTDTCQCGTCKGSGSVTCAALDQCHVAGTCDTSIGACTNPAVTDGTACNDGNACTVGDACQAGTCVGGSRSAICTPTCVVIQRTGASGIVYDTAIKNQAPYPNNAYGTSGTMSVGLSGSPTAYERQDLLAFDLSSVPQGSLVASATVTLFTNPQTSGTVINVHKVTAAWPETTVTWGTFGGRYVPAPATSLSPGPANPLDLANPQQVPPNQVSFNIDALVQGWLDAPASNFGILLEQPLVAGQSTVVRTSEWPTVALRPSLQVCYVP